MKSIKSVLPIRTLHRFVPADMKHITPVYVLSTHIVERNAATVGSTGRWNTSVPASFLALSHCFFTLLHLLLPWDLTVLLTAAARSALSSPCSDSTSCSSSVPPWSSTVNTSGKARLTLPVSGGGASGFVTPSRNCVISLSSSVFRADSFLSPSCFSSFNR